MTINEYEYKRQDIYESVLHGFKEEDFEKKNTIDPGKVWMMAKVLQTEAEIQKIKQAKMDEKTDSIIRFRN